jgi:hypothetical protein
MSGDEAALGLWLGVVASGLYHGLSPGMGWPLAVTAGLMERRDRAVLEALGPLALGHFAAIALALLPFAALSVLMDARREIQIGAGLLVIGFGAWKLLDRRHPRALARIPPTRLALWSFAMALAHGAGLMLVPIFLGLCASPDDGHAAHLAAVGPGAAATALGVTALHTLAMFAAGGAAAWLVYSRLGLAALTRGWLNLEAVWALSLIAAGASGLWLAL